MEQLLVKMEESSRHVQSVTVSRSVSECCPLCVSLHVCVSLLAMSNKFRRRTNLTQYTLSLDT